MFSLFVTELYLTFILSIVLFTSQSVESILNRQGLYNLEDTNHLVKRVTSINIADTFKGIRNVVNVGGIKSWSFNPNTEGAYTTREFYGCTVVVAVDGHGVMIGHFAQIDRKGCISMTNEDTVKQVIGTLSDNQGGPHFNTNTQIYIIIGYGQLESIGQTAIVDHFQTEGVLAQNIKTITYVPSSSMEFPGIPKGKVVVTWKPNGGGNGALLDVYIQDNDPIFEQAYDNAGNPVGAAACAGNNKHKRQDECALPGAAEGNSTAASASDVFPESSAISWPSASAVYSAVLAASTVGPTTTAPAITAMPTCYQQNQDPDQGIEQQGCVCNLGSVTKTLAILATNVSYTSSCAYTALSSQSTIAITTETLGPATTNIAFCQVCSPLQDYGATCTSLPSCSPATPTATIQIGTSQVPVGTMGSSALSFTISSAVASLCPPITQTASLTTCDETSKVTVKDIVYKDGATTYTDGELTIQIDSSGYNDTALLGPMAEMAALSLASSATGGNCFNESVETPEIGPQKVERWYSTTMDTALSFLPFHKREPEAVYPYSAEKYYEICNAGHFASPQIYSLGWREAPSPGPSNYLSVAISFTKPPDGVILCAFLDGLTEVVETVITPELLGAEQYIDEAIDIGCADADVATYGGG